MEFARFRHTATLLNDGRVLVVGGNSATGALATAELFDPSTLTWTRAADMGTARYRQTATMLFDGRVLIAAGAADTYNLDSSEIYDPATDTWTPTSLLQRVTRFPHRHPFV